MYLEAKINEQRYIDMNQIRITKAKEVMHEHVRKLFEIIPVLLHYNHPLIPGYTEGEVPHGIYNFKPNDEQVRFTQSLTLASGAFDQFIAQDESILALYCMGSTSSIGQSPKSDIDYWVCISRYLSSKRISLLEKKCAFISNMAKSRGAEINFFIVKDDKFFATNEDEVTDDDSCGSAQRMFLLDEFYRSSIYVAGKKLLWMIVPCAQEMNYKNYVKALVDNRIINRDDWLDFGNIGEIPSDEYYGSALWLMYKGIDSPFKAVLKIMLMEAYSAEYPHTSLLSMQIKDWFHRNDGYSLQLDSYYMVYQKISKYLLNRNDTARMNLIRLCFYQKVSDGLRHMTNPNAISSRRMIIRSLIDAWGWTKDDVEFIDNQVRWRLKEIAHVYRLIFNALMRSYHALLNFGIKNKISDKIRSVDISLLSRKLFVAFDTYPGKIKLYNLNLGTNVTENTMSLIEVCNSKFFKDGWYLYFCSMQPEEIIGKAPIISFSDLGSAIVTTYVNGVLTPHTKIFLRTNNPFVNDDKVKQLYNDLRTVFADKPRNVTNEDLLMPAKIQKLGIFVNFSNDPTATDDYQHVGHSATNVNVFTSGVRSKSMVGSILTVFSNSWHEIVCNHYEGEMAIFDFIHDVRNYLNMAEEKLPQWQLFNYSQHMRAFITTQMSDTFAKCLSMIASAQNDRYSLIINNDEYVVSVEDGNFDIALQTFVQAQEIILEESMSDVHSDAQHIPEVVLKNACFGFRQFFFAKREDGLYDLYEVDETKHTKAYYGFKGAITDMVYDINVYYSKSMNLDNGKNIRYKQYFNLPQFYTIDIVNDTIQPLII